VIIIIILTHLITSLITFNTIRYQPITTLIINNNNNTLILIIPNNSDSSPTTTTTTFIRISIIHNNSNITYSNNDNNSNSSCRILAVTTPIRDPTISPPRLFPKSLRFHHQLGLLA